MDATHQLLKCAEITMNWPGQNRENDEKGRTKKNGRCSIHFGNLDSFTLFPSVVNKFFIRTIDVYWWLVLCIDKTICWFVVVRIFTNSMKYCTINGVSFILYASRLRHSPRMIIICKCQQTKNIHSCFGWCWLYSLDICSLISYFHCILLAVCDSSRQWEHVIILFAYMWNAFDFIDSKWRQSLKSR